ncbi:MAG: hypothetical protein WC954_03230 [Sphaerochaeta sp.]|jgi:hypothetical protein
MHSEGSPAEIGYIVSANLQGFSHDISVEGGVLFPSGGGVTGLDLLVQGGGGNDQTPDQNNAIVSISPTPIGLFVFTIEVTVSLDEDDWQRATSGEYTATISLEFTTP